MYFALFYRLSSDSEIQTQIQQGSASTQTGYEEDSQWYKYTRTVEEVRESSEKVASNSRQFFDSETQTDIPVDHDLRVLVTTQEGEYKRGLLEHSFEFNDTILKPEYL